MRTANLVLTCCQDCPHMNSERHYTGDSFEHVEDWTCDLMKNKSTDAHGKRITLYEYPDKKPEIPYWCPLSK